MERTRATRNKHFVLVPGACFGAWSWYKVAAKLKSGGHKVTALDMAASGINPKGAEDVQSVMDYAEPLMEFMEALPPDEGVILVGHSRGGVCISLAMEKFPHKIAVAVFLSAFMPCLGVDMGSIYAKYKRPLEFYMDCKALHGKNDRPISILFGPKYMSTRLFQLCAPEDLELALLLIRPTPASPNEEDSLEKDGNILTKENYGSVRRVYIKPEDDKLVNEPIEKFRLENYPPEELKIIPTADHMAMLSNPQDLSSCLQEISQKYD